ARVVAPLLEEALVVLAGRLEQLLAERLEAGDVEQLVLADLGEVLIDGGPGLAKVGLGTDPLPVDQHGAHRQGDDRREQQRPGRRDRRPVPPPPPRPPAGAPGGGGGAVPGWAARRCLMPGARSTASASRPAGRSPSPWRHPPGAAGGPPATPARGGAGGW